MRDRALPGEPIFGAVDVELATCGGNAEIGLKPSDVVGEVTADAVGPACGFSSGIAKDAARAASMLESK